MKSLENEGDTSRGQAQITKSAGEPDFGVHYSEPRTPAGREGPSNRVGSIRGGRLVPSPPLSAGDRPQGIPDPSRGPTAPTPSRHAPRLGR
jgi:hypothetical protein